MIVRVHSWTLGMLCGHWDKNLQPSDLCLLTGALLSFHEFAFLPLITLPLWVASTLGNLAEATKMASVVGTSNKVVMQKFHLKPCDTRTTYSTSLSSLCDINNYQ